MALRPPPGGIDLDSLFREHATPLLRLAVVLTGDRPLAEELVQEAFVRLHRSGSIPLAGTELAYLRRTVINLSHGHHRHLRVVRRQPEPTVTTAPAADVDVVRRDGQRQVAAAVRTLPTRQRDCIVLRFYADLSDAEIADTLGISAGSVKTHLHRARAALADRLEALPMSDQTPDPHDDLLRAALEAEADDVVAGPELLDRIRTEAAKPDRRLAPWLLVAAAVVAVIGIGAVLLRDDDQAVDSVDDPTTTSSTTDTTGPAPDLTSLLAIEVACEQGEVLDLTVYMRQDASEADVTAMGQALAADARITSARYLDHDAMVDAISAYHDGVLGQREVASIPLPTAYVVDLADGADETAVRSDLADLPGVYGLYDVGCTAGEPVDPPPLGQRPTLVALVREDGWLVTVDLQTGQQRELHFVGDPNATSDVPEGGPSFIDSVDLSPPGGWIYFSTCCEPAVGQTFRIPTTGGEPEPVAMGANPRVSPDGRFVATGGSEMVIVTPTPGVGGDPVTVEVGCCARSLAWSPDGSQLAVVSGTGAEGETPQVLLFGWDGTALTPRDTGKPDNPGWFVSWAPGGTLNISSGDPIADDRSLSQDITYRWLLWVDEAGVMREQAGVESGDRTPIAELPEALAADW